MSFSNVSLVTDTDKRRRATSITNEKIEWTQWNCLETVNACVCVCVSCVSILSTKDEPRKRAERKWVEIVVFLSATHNNKYSNDSLLSRSVRATSIFTEFFIRNNKLSFHSIDDDYDTHNIPLTQSSSFLCPVAFEIGSFWCHNLSHRSSFIWMNCNRFQVNELVMSTNCIHCHVGQQWTIDHHLTHRLLDIEQCTIVGRHSAAEYIFVRRRNTEIESGARIMNNPKRNAITRKGLKLKLFHVRGVFCRTTTPSLGDNGCVGTRFHVAARQG